MSTKTGSVTTRHPIEDVIMTRPTNPRALRIYDDEATACKLSWLPPEHHHSCLRSYRVQIRTLDDRIVNDVAVLKSTKTFLIEGLQQCTDYNIDVTAVCIKNEMRTVSEPSSAKFTTLPETIKSLRLDNATTDSITVTWDIPIVTSGIKYVLSISGNTNKKEEENQDANDEDMDNIQNFEMINIQVDGDKNQYTFSKLPDITGSGHAFKVSIVTVYASPREIETISKECQEIFMTKPLPPTNLGMDSTNGQFQINWHKSMTPNVTKYRIQWTSMTSDDIGTEEETMECQPNEETMYFQFSPELVQDNTTYKVHVYAIATYCDLEAESEELQGKFFFVKDPLRMTILTESE